MELIIANACAGGVLVILLVWYCCKRTRRRRPVVPDFDDPEYIIAELRKNTKEVSVKFEDIEFGRVVGKGSQGSVFSAIYKGTKVAVKVVDVNKVDIDTVEEFCSEARIMQSLRHPFLTLFMGVAIKQPSLCIVTEFVDRGSLFELLNDDAPFSWKKRMQIAEDIAQALCYLHGMSPPMLHRDLKSLNILITTNWRAKVADFGMTRFADTGTMTQCGSPLWMAPEMIDNRPYDTKSDVYSFGIVLWELYNRQIPYRRLRHAPSEVVVKVVEENLRPKIPHYCPAAFATLLRECWDADPRKRPTFPEVLKRIQRLRIDPTVMGHDPQTGKTYLVVGLTGDIDDNDDEKGRQRVVDYPSNIEAIQDPTDFPAAGGDAWRLKGKELDITKQISNNTQDKNGRARTLVFEGAYRGKTVWSWVIPIQPIIDYFKEHPDAPVPDPETILQTVYAEADPNSSDSELSESEQSPDRKTELSRSEAVVECCWKIMARMSEFGHPNLVLFMGAYEDTDRHGNVVMGVVLEKMDRGSVASLISNPQVTLDWEASLNFLISGAVALNFMHLHRPPVVHEDLRTNKLLVDKNWRVKLTGYGFGHGLFHKITRTAPPLSIWSPPEVIEDASNVCTASNVYTYALIVVHVLTRRVPFGGLSGESKGVVDTLDDGEELTPDLRRRILRGAHPTIPSSLSPEFRRFLRQCFHYDPVQRPSMEEFLEMLNEVKEAGPPKITLTYQNACLYRKANTVFAYQSADPVTILKDWGKSVGGPMSYVVVQDVDDVYCCDADVFHSTYENAGSGILHEYRKVGKVLARCMEEPFAVKASGGIEHGRAGDYLLQNTVDKHQWVVEAPTFEKWYERCSF